LAAGAPVAETLPVKRYPDGRATVTVELPAAGMAILA
jgi:hypothetical protein